jgi:hypothetical protein
MIRIKSKICDINNHIIKTNPFSNEQSIIVEYGDTDKIIAEYFKDKDEFILNTISFNGNIPIRVFPKHFIGFDNYRMIGSYSSKEYPDKNTIEFEIEYEDEINEKSLYHFKGFWFEKIFRIVRVEDVSGYDVGFGICDNCEFLKEYNTGGNGVDEPEYIELICTKRKIIELVPKEDQLTECNEFKPIIDGEDNA